MSDIFISCSKPGRPLAQKLAALLGKTWTVWWDPKIPPGRRFADVIHEEADIPMGLRTIEAANLIGWNFDEKDEEYANLRAELSRRLQAGHRQATTAN